MPQEEEKLWSEEKVSLCTLLHNITPSCSHEMFITGQFCSKSYGHCGFGLPDLQNPCTWQSPASYLVTLYPSTLHSWQQAFTYVPF